VWIITMSASATLVSLALYVHLPSVVWLRDLAAFPRTASLRASVRHEPREKVLEKARTVSALAGNVLREKHLVFIGDSAMRYQYLNLAYHVAHGRGPPELLEGVLKRPRGVNDTGAGQTDTSAVWYALTNELFGGRNVSEVCDCCRDGSASFENRYFSAAHQIAITFIQWLGNDTLRGHWSAAKQGLQKPAMWPGRCVLPVTWSLPADDPATLLRDVVLPLYPEPTHVIMSRHEGGSLAPDKFEELATFAATLTPRFIWKTRTEALQQSEEDKLLEAERECTSARRHGWKCLDVYRIRSAFAHLHWDAVHVRETANSYINSVLLDML